MGALPARRVLRNMNAIADTHTVIWHIYNDPRLSARAKGFLESSAQAGEVVGLSAITLAEIIYLVEKGRIHQETLQRVLAALDVPNSAFILIPFDRAIAET